MPDRILLTGATGFVGSHVAERLRAEGHPLRCTVRTSSDLRWLDGVDVDMAEVELTDGGGLGTALEDVGCVVHVAGITRAARDRDFFRVNAEGTARLARAARRAGVRRFVFVSSLAARGPDGAGEPGSPYGRSNREAEERLRTVAAETAVRSDGEGRRDALEVAVLRPGGVYGPRDTDLLPLFRLADRGWFPVAPSSGLVQPIYAEDVAGAVERAVRSDAPGFGPWPLAETRRYRWSELAGAMEEALGRPVRTLPLPGALLVAAGAAAEFAAKAVARPPVFDRRSARDLARRSWTCDPSPTMEALGWEPVVGLVEGLARTAAWYREAGWL